eukprot:2538087-Amphidinium_carterae.1
MNLAVMDTEQNESSSAPPILLGIDFLRKNKCLIDFERDILYIDGGKQMIQMTRARNGLQTIPLTAAAAARLDLE